MEVSSAHQIYVFALCIISGIVCGIFFDLQRSLRRLVFAGSIRTMLEDAVFALVCALVTIAMGLCFNNGEIRYYQIMGAVSGALFYAAFLSNAVMRLLALIYAALKRLIVIPFIKLFKIIRIPCGKIYSLFKKIFSKLRRLSKKFVRRISARKKHLKKRIKML